MGSPSASSFLLFPFLSKVYAIPTPPSFPTLTKALAVVWQTNLPELTFQQRVNKQGSIY